MQITYNGSVVAREPQQGGGDFVTGFLPALDLLDQDAPLLRAQFKETFPRGNASQILTGQITFAPFSSLGACMSDMMGKLLGLPTSGDLVFLEGASISTFVNAKLRPSRVLWRYGVRYAIELTFVVNSLPVLTTYSPLQTESGQALETEAGAQIIPDS